jgi:hypothetical protein
MAKMKEYYYYWMEYFDLHPEEDELEYLLGGYDAIMDKNNDILCGLREEEINTSNIN